MNKVPRNIALMLLGLFLSDGIRAADTPGVLQALPPSINGLGATQVPSEMTLFVGDSRVFDLRTVRVAVGNGKIVSVSPIGGQQLVFIGQSIGSTVVQFWLRGGGLHRMTVTVVANDLVATLSAVNELLHDVRGVKAALRGSRVVLEGDAADSRARERAASVAAMFPGTVVDFVAKPGWEVMVHVDVRIVEFRRGRLRELGIRWRDETDGPNAGVIGDLLANDRFRVIPPESGIPPEAFDPLPVKTAVRGYLGIASTLDSRLRMLEQVGEATIVAEPQLSCRSGGAARFVAGGEIPVPVVNGVGSTDVEYREYGVILDIKPVADASGAIFARIETELSQIDGAQRINGVPGLLKRRSTTDINLRSGETLVIAGLASRQRSVDNAGLPGLVRIPGVGRLFGTRGQRGEESEIVIFLTPRVARQVDLSASGASRPDASRIEAAEASDLEILRRAQQRIDALREAFPALDRPLESAPERARERTPERAP
jgi:pilus assembly protein CpaC